MRSIQLILNGKVASNASLSDAIAKVRLLGYPLEIRVTREAGDGVRLAKEACEAGMDIIIAGGGDGTLHEVVNGVFQVGNSPTCALGVVPLGTANDFARSCGIPADPFGALLLAVKGRPLAIDVAKANEHFFVNVASGGFGARVTATTSPELKRAFGGAAYALMGFIEILKMPSSRPVHVRTPDGQIHETVVLGAIGNGRQAGGGFQVTPQALLDDGLLDVLLVRDIALSEINHLFQELRNPGAPENKFTFYRQVPWLEIEEPVVGIRFINLDGEAVLGCPKSIRFELLHRRLPFVLPPAAAPLVQQAIEPS